MAHAAQHQAPAAAPKLPRNAQPELEVVCCNVR